ncbi:MAG: hypothetical protein WB662_11155 [Methyloceanibacter sp.]
MSDYVVHFTKPLDQRDIVKPPPPKDPTRLTRGEMLAEVDHINQQDGTGYYQWRLIVGDKPRGAVNGLSATWKARSTAAIGPSR